MGGYRFSVAGPKRGIVRGRKEVRGAGVGPVGVGIFEGITKVMGQTSAETRGSESVTLEGVDVSLALSLRSGGLLLYYSASTL